MSPSRNSHWVWLLPALVRWNSTEKILQRRQRLALLPGQIPSHPSTTVLFAGSSEGGDTNAPAKQLATSRKVCAEESTFGSSSLFF